MKTHLGCGIWCEFDGAVFTLTQERDGGQVVDRFVLHPSELQALDEFRRRMVKHQRAPIASSASGVALPAPESPW